MTSQTFGGQNETLNKKSKDYEPMLIKNEDEDQSAEQSTTKQRRMKRNKQRKDVKDFI